MTRSWSELDNEKLTRIAMTSRNSCHLAVAILDIGYILCSLSRVMSLSRKNITGFSFFPFRRSDLPAVLKDETTLLQKNMDE